MFDWISDLISGIGNAISSALSGVWETVSGSIWGVFMNWLYTSVYNALADFFTMMTELGANLFDLSWVQAALKFFSLFGWGLFIAGLAVAIFDIAIEYQSMGRINIKRQILPFLYGLLAVNLFTVVPVQLFRFAVNLQNTFAKDLVGEVVGMNVNFDLLSHQALTIIGVPGISTKNSLLALLMLICLGYCVIKCFFSNIKRGGILLTQIAVGSLHMFSLPRGYSEGFTGWCKQIIYGIHADDAFATRHVYDADARTSRSWRYAGGKRSASHCAAVRLGYKHESQHDECSAYDDNGDQPRTGDCKEIIQRGKQKRNAKTVYLPAEYADSGKAVVLESEGCHHPCHRSHHIGGFMGKARIYPSCRPDARVCVPLHTDGRVFGAGFYQTRLAVLCIHTAIL